MEWCSIDGEFGVQLEKPFSHDEIKRTVFESDGENAPGPDGFTLTFYQECWDIVKGVPIKVFREFFEGGVINGIINETYLFDKKETILCQGKRL